MIIVPIKKDVIITRDHVTLTVLNYTNYKDAGPAVYARVRGEKTTIPVYFQDIEYVNGARVDFIRGSKVFRALGNLHREQPLPQPGDKVIVLEHNIGRGEDVKDTQEVVGLKLRSRTFGYNHGMAIQLADDRLIRLKQVLDIIPSIGSDEFNREMFLKIYHDYVGV